MDKGTMKLGDLFINEKTLKPARKNWPVLVNQDGKILWVVGLRADDRFRISPSSKQVLEIKLERVR
jgi:tRNA(Ile)-lysidine synthase